MNKFILSVLPGIAGFAFAIIFTPVPNLKNDCSVYKVLPKTITSFVLKPPVQAPVMIKEACPTVERCEAPKVEEEVEKPKVHRRHRVRRYWR